MLHARIAAHRQQRANTTHTMDHALHITYTYHLAFRKLAMESHLQFSTSVTRWAQRTR